MFTFVLPHHQMNVPLNHEITTSTILKLDLEQFICTENVKDGKIETLKEGFLSVFCDAIVIVLVLLLYHYSLNIG